MKNAMKKTTSRPGFTLVELLVVIAIIGLLAGLLLPAITGGMRTAQRSQAQASVGQIAKSHYAIAIAGLPPVTIIGANTRAWSLALANAGGVNEVDLYYAGTHAKTAATLIVAPTIQADAANWILGTNAGGAAGGIAYDVVTNLPATILGQSVYPLIWTTGVAAGGGAWAGTSPWGTDGGHVGYADGHVEWMTTTTPASGELPFIDYASAPAAATGSFTTACVDAALGAAVVIRNP